jgi:hypothetical protein
VDTFDVLKAISKRKIEFMHSGVDENNALKNAEFIVSDEFHIPLHDIEKLYSSRNRLWI